MKYLNLFAAENENWNKSLKSEREWGICLIIFLVAMAIGALFGLI